MEIKNNPQITIVYNILYLFMDQLELNFELID